MNRDLTPVRIWIGLSPELRMLAARSYDWRSADMKREADLAIARSLNFRETFVRRLPLEKRIGYLASAVRPDDSLAASLLLSLHLGHRRPLLAAFMDALGIEHDNGLITGDKKIAPPSASALSEAVSGLYRSFPEDQVTLYLHCLVAIDPGTWGGLRETLAATR